MKAHDVFWFSLVAVLGVHLPAASQDFEAEPNDTCLTAQNVGALGLPHTVAGSLDTPPDVPDVDFFRFTGTPGQRLLAHLRGESSGAGTLRDPFLGLFDSTCELLESNDDFLSLDSRLDFTIPDDGIIVLGASSCCDFDFAGVGGSAGTYELEVDFPPPPIGSISGTLVDAVSGVPLPGNQLPFSFVRLFRCDGADCDEFVASEVPDDLGRFTFDESSTFRTIDAGSYRIVAVADEYLEGETDPFDVPPGGKIDVGTIALEPFPISVVDVVECDDLSPAGGLCSYSASVRNNSGERRRLVVWSIVDGFGLGSRGDRTVFEASARRRVRILPLKSKTVSFRFRVPADVAEGAFFCADIYVGEEPNGRFHTLVSESLFCVSKRDAVFTVLSEKEALAKLRGLGLDQLRRTPSIPRERRK